MEGEGWGRSDDNKGNKRDRDVDDIGGKSGVEKVEKERGYELYEGWKEER
jgi:hypothetical protein